MKLKDTLRRKAKGKKGFTLVELVIVIAVLAIIAAIAIPTVTNVIGNANTAADASNAQAIELAIKTSQAECAANATNHSERAKNVITAKPQTLSVILSNYGVPAETISSPKVSGDKFFYNPTTGKVIAKAATSVSGYAQIAGDTPYTAEDDAKAAVTDGDKPANIVLTVTVATADK